MRAYYGCRHGISNPSMRHRSEEFELKPDKPGFANRCPSCSEEEESLPKTKKSMDADERKTVKEANEERRRVMRDLLYRKDS